MNDIDRRILKLFFALFSCLLFCLSCIAQSAFPETDIFLIDYKQVKGSWTFGTPENISARKGYDNQPSFSSDGKTIYFTAVHSENQADIFSYSIKQKTTQRITKSMESEFSPVEIKKDKFLSVVRVELDSTQRLVKIPLSGTGAVRLLEKEDSIGYYAYIDKNHLAAFVLTNPFSLRIYSLDGTHRIVAAENVGRCLKKIPGKRALSFVDKSNPDKWFIKELEIRSRERDRHVQIKSEKLIVQTLPGSEDYAWTPEGILLSGSEGKLYKFDPHVDVEWVLIADFTSYGIENFYRISASQKSNKIAIVSFEGQRP